MRGFVLISLSLIFLLFLFTYIIIVTSDEMMEREKIIDD